MLGGACGSVGQRSVGHRPTRLCTNTADFLPHLPHLPHLFQMVDLTGGFGGFVTVGSPTISGAWMTVWRTVAGRDAEQCVGLIAAPGRQSIGPLLELGTVSEPPPLGRARNFG